MTHRLHSRVRQLERKTKRRRLAKWSSWLAVAYPADSEVEIANDAHAALDRLRSACAAVIERFERWRRRNPNKPGMPLRPTERDAVGEALRSADYIAEFDERFPHRHDGVPCRVVHGDAELLAKPDASLLIWEVVEPVLSPQDAALKAEHEARRVRADDESNTPHGADSNTQRVADLVQPTRPMTPDELRRQQARESFERRIDPDTRYGGVDHAPTEQQEFTEARRQRRVDVRSLSFLLTPRRNPRR